MMSPDPPRSDPFNNESTSDGAPVPGGGIFRPIDEVDDIMGEGDHVLDYSSQPESWTSDDEEGDGTGHHQMEDEVDEVGNVRVRTQYRMLIPFEIVDDNEPDSSEDVIHDQTFHNPPSDLTEINLLLNTIPGVDGSASSPQGLETGNCQRETTPLTDENVQKIKEVMQSFKLPDSAIPNWAKEVTEDAWRKKLVDSLKSKNLEPKPN